MVGVSGEMKLNSSLVQYGIYEEDKDIIRCHVSIKTKRVYVFSVGDVRSLDIAKYKEVGASQSGIKTALGRLIPPSDILNIFECMIPETWIKKAEQYALSTTSIKGQIAVSITKELLKLGRIRLPLTISEVTDQQMQISGTDILILATIKMQVKCDWNAGHRNMGGTGNLFIQTHECNPFGLH